MYIIPIYIASLNSRRRQLPDGLRTNGVVAEMARFPVMNCHGET